MGYIPRYSDVPVLVRSWDVTIGLTLALSLSSSSSSSSTPCTITEGYT